MVTAGTSSKRVTGNEHRRSGNLPGHLAGGHRVVSPTSHLDWVLDCLAFKRKRWFTNSLSQVADELGLAERQKSDLIEYLKSL
jgi:hypothetical protein